MQITILGTGCAKCNSLEAATRAAVAELGVDADIDHVTDPGAIVSWGVMATPALAIDDEVVVSGRVPSSAEVAALLSGR